MSLARSTAQKQKIKSVRVGEEILRGDLGISWMSSNRAPKVRKHRTNEINKMGNKSGEINNTKNSSLKKVAPFSPLGEAAVGSGRSRHVSQGQSRADQQ